VLFDKSLTETPSTLEDWKQVTVSLMHKLHSKK